MGRKIEFSQRYFNDGDHISDIYITETDTTELENLSHNIIGSSYLGPQGERKVCQ